MVYKPKCLGKDNVHKPDYLVKLYTVETGPGVGEEVAFTWCKECGAVSVDKQYDGRFNSTIVDLKFPKVVGLEKNYLNKNNQDFSKNHRNLYNLGFPDFIMKKIGILLLFLLIIPSVLAINLTIDKQSINEVMIVETNDPAIINLQVTNNENSDNFRFYTFFGLGLEPTKKVSINKGETKEVELKILPREDYKPRGFTTFEYFIKASDDTEMAQKLTINVIDVKDAFEIGTQKIDPQSSSIEIYVYNKVNFDFKEVQAKFDSPFFKLDQKFDIGPNEKEVFKINLNKEDFNELTAGFYTLEAEISYKEVNAILESNIEFEEKDIVETTSNQYGFIINKKIIQKSNEGNKIAEATTTVKKNIISRVFTSFEPEPSIVNREGFSVYYTWNYQLNPGETYTINVKTNWIIPFAIIILIILIVFLTKIFLRRDLVLKKRVHFVRAKGGEFALKVSIIVSAKKFLEKAHVTDRLPPLVKIYEKFLGEQPSKVDISRKRIEWNFEKLEQGERRVLSYIIYSKVGVLGKFALPRASAIYEREGKIKESSSNQTYFIAEQVGKEKESY
ncbi:MAG: hypothetical protein KC516_01575 [Nanoarchaeota archaeon]|nr:hypothetical protein [Nanoarchaeota archaeon]